MDYRGLGDALISNTELQTRVAANGGTVSSPWYSGLFDVLNTGIKAGVDIYKTEKGYGTIPGGAEAQSVPLQPQKSNTGMYLGIAGAAVGVIALIAATR